jgi:excisionase family DNA binding protein
MCPFQAEVEPMVPAASWRAGCACISVAENFEILSVMNVAALLGCSKAHVCKAIQGRVVGVTPLPAITMGRRKLIRRQSLDAWLAENDPASSGDMLKPSHTVTP